MTTPPDNFENDLRRIPARSHRQVMDWSLVLASQEIEASIARDEQGWAIFVNPGDYDHAVQTITLYRIENRSFRWRQPLPVSGVLFHWGSGIWSLCVVWVFLWSSMRADLLKNIAFMDNRAVNAGEWWRVFTAITLHADVAHLAANVTTGFLLLGLAMARYGAGAGLLASYLAGAGGNLAAWLLYDETHRGLGASGMVMGALGLVAMQSVSGWRKISLTFQVALRAVAAGLFLFILMGTSPGTDVVAHLGGFCFGLVFGLILSFTEKFSLASNVNRACLLLVPGWVLLTWSLVFRQLR